MIAVDKIAGLHFTGLQKGPDYAECHKYTCVQLCGNVRFISLP